ncbi:hypothetical protein KEM56_006032 [Ascosphaera pollenicola]|nr:hypothetical protein KEM56_006032 [Ascosphaera pollenicola]
MFLIPVDLTTALRPVLLPDESLHFVQDAVGLYHGRDKIPDRQNGHAYLTSHRICYVDGEDPRKRSLAVELRNVERAEIQAGFLRSSPKISLYQKKTKTWGISDKGSIASATLDANAAAQQRQSRPDPTRVVNATWICTICSFANPVPLNFNPETANAYGTPLPPCLACGIKVSFATLLKAAISARSEGLSHSVRNANANAGAAPVSQPVNSKNAATLTCPRCTFENHGSIMSCEMCGASLQSIPERGVARVPVAEQANLPSFQPTDVLKLSFRSGGDRTFYERLKNALVQRKWMLANAPPVPKLEQQSNPSSPGRNSSPIWDESKQIQRKPNAVGIAGLERQRQEARHNNEAVIGDAFEDLETLMASAKQIVALAESFAATAGAGTPINDAAGTQEASTILSQLGSLVTTKDVLGSGSSSETLYLTELSRSLAEWLTAPPPSASGSSILNREGGIMALVDVWSLFNRARNGVELVSPTDFRKAADLWSKLKLPVRLRQFRSGVQAVQRSDWSDEITLKKIREWLDELRSIPPSISTIGVESDDATRVDDSAILWDWRRYGRGVTAQEAAARFRWSVGVAAEELEMAEEHGVVCREESIEGLRFWRNFLSGEDEHDVDDTHLTKQELHDRVGLLTV